MVKREWYRDRYNSKKTWEVVKMVGGYYLRQYVDGQQVNTGLRTTKAFIASIGIFEFERIAQEDKVMTNLANKIGGALFGVAVGDLSLIHI